MTCEKLFLATTNPTKIEKIKQILGGFGFYYLTPNDVGQTIEIEEDGKSFEENAVKKAITWSKMTDYLTIATDGGAFIPALKNNWNPLQTHRFAGFKATEKDRCEELLEMMKPYQDEEERVVYWKEALAVAQNGNKVASWQVKGDKGILTKSYDASKMLEGWWIGSLWLIPEAGKTASELILDGTREQFSSVWWEHKKKLQNFLLRYRQK